MYELCVIGSGNMGKAMVRGVLQAKLLKPSEIIMTDVDEKRVKAIEEELGIGGGTDNRKAVGESHVIVLAVKPQFLVSAIDGFADSVKEKSIIVSIAPGKTLEQLQAKFAKGTKIIRAMPNTPAMVMEGMTGLCPNGEVTKDELREVKGIFEAFGRAEVIAENVMDAVVGISGSSPAYVCLMIEALADAAVKEGLNRPQAYIFAEQAVMGSAKLLLDKKMHPGELKDMVCSPGGTTIEAVSRLEDGQFRGTIMQAVEACVKKSREL